MLRNYFRRIYAGFLCTATIFTFSACSAPSEDSSAATQQSVSQSEATTGEVTAQSVLDSMPDADYGGYEFKVWTSNRANPTLEIRQASRVMPRCTGLLGA